MPAPSYKPEYDAMLIAHMRTGRSFWSFGAVVTAGRTTLHDWCNAHPSFKAARGVGEILSLSSWEDLGTNGIVGQLKNFQTAGWIYTMKCRFRQFGYGLDSAPMGSAPGDDATEADKLDSATLLKIVRGNGRN